MCGKFRSFGQQMDAFRKKPYFLVLGIMSGTSTDGLDLALCRFEKKRQKWQYHILKARTLKYSAPTKEFLRTVHSLGAAEFVSAHLQYGKIIARAVKQFLKAVPEKPFLIASHGHTIFHSPDSLACFQLGHGGAIASLTGIPCVSDFRTQDIILGGQGAPLVPLGDIELFNSYDGCLNLGGISNISFIKNNQAKAFDISPCNLPLNLVASKLGKQFDKGGKIASAGSVNADFLKALNQHEYYGQRGPKSLGREWLEREFMPVLSRFAHLQAPDMLATLCEHIAFQTGSAIGQNRLTKVLTTGGGAHHQHLINRIRYYSGKTEIIVPERLTIDFKEALIFAFLGLFRFLSLPNTLPSVTGSSSASSSGSLWLP